VSVRTAANALESGLHWNPSPDWVIPLRSDRRFLCLQLGRPRPLGGWGLGREVGANARSGEGRAKAKPTPLKLREYDTNEYLAPKIISRLWE